MDLSPKIQLTQAVSINSDVLKTVEVGNRAGYSTQQVRDLEKLGVIPKALRSSNGYRQYGVEQVDTLLAYRGLAIAAGPLRARKLMPVTSR